MSEIKPNYYKGKSNDIDFWIDILNLNFRTGNCLKYLIRYKNKNGLEDLLKVQEYFSREKTNINSGNSPINNYDSLELLIDDFSLQGTKEGEFIINLITALDTPYQGEKVFEIHSLTEKCDSILIELIEKQKVNKKIKIKSFAEYQTKAASFAVYPNIGKNVLYPMVGLIGEVGELMNKIINKDFITVLLRNANLINFFNEIDERLQRAEYLKKKFRKKEIELSDNEFPNDKFSQEEKNSLKKEVGDVLWYIASMCEEFGFSMADIAQENIEKLTSRKEQNMIIGEGDNRENQKTD